MSFRPSGTLGAEIAKHLSGMIIRAELKPGEKIPEESMADRLGVSRSPLREALRILEKDKLVESTPRRGVRVSQMTPQCVDWLFDILAELYSLGAKEFAQNSTQDDREKLCLVLGMLESCAERNDVLGYAQAIMEYAGVGRQGAKNPLLEQILKELDGSMARVEYAAVSVQARNLRKNVKLLRQATKYAAQRPNPEKAAQSTRMFFEHERKQLKSRLRVQSDLLNSESTGEGSNHSIKSIKDLTSGPIGS